jgi:hypothetical protein
MDGVLRRPALLLVPVLLLTGCAQAQEAADTVQDCAGLASDVARSGLGGVPTQEEAEQALQRLDERVANLDSEQVRGAATELRDRLRDLVEATRAADPAAVERAAGEARDAARQAAEICSLPVDQFLGG